MCEPGNVSWVAPAKLQIDLLEKLVRAGLPPIVSRVALLRLEALLFFDRPDPWKEMNIHVLTRIFYFVNLSK